MGNKGREPHEDTRGSQRRVYQQEGKELTVTTEADETSERVLQERVVEFDGLGTRSQGKISAKEM